ncbi:MAG: hypothetical protein QM726_05835 [Chitinophagaceae bacterium]
MLNKLIAFILIIVLLFSSGGYRWFINALQVQADNALERKMDHKDYDESGLMTIVVPVYMPYNSDKENFENSDGDIEYNGVHYRYVSHKIQNGLLIIKCLPNRVRQKLEIAKTELFRISNNMEQGHDQKKSPNVQKVSLSDYISLSHKNPSFSISDANERSYNSYVQPLISNLHDARLPKPPEA